MAAIVLSLIGALMGGAVVWLLLGDRFQLASADRNGLANLCAYAGMLFPFALLFVALILPRLSG